MFRSDPIAASYNITWNAVIGQGLNPVYRASHVSANNRAVAIKLIPDTAAARREAQTMLACQCESTVRLHEVFEGAMALPDDREPRAYLALVMELMRGGELFFRVANDALSSELAIRCIVRSIAQSLRQIHARGLVHRDVKLENVLFACDSKECFSAKLGDFGFAIPAAEVQLEPVLFTLCNASPEMIRALHNAQHGMRLPVPEYDSKSDMWALGVILFSMVAGYHPFQSTDSNTAAGQAALVRRIRNGKFSMDDQDLHSISTDGQRVLLSLLSTDPTRRPSAEDLLADPWLAPLHAVSPFRACKCTHPALDQPRSPVAVAAAPSDPKPEPASPKLELRVHVIQNMSFARMLYVRLPHLNLPVAHLGDIVAAEHGIAVPLQQFIFKGAVLRPEDTLASCGIDDKSTVFLAVRRAPELKLVPLAESTNSLLQRRLATNVTQ